MSQRIHRRELLGWSTAAVAGTTLGTSTPLSAAAAAPAKKRRFKLGMVTYNVARAWDLDTIIRNYKKIGLAAVEFRSTHKHGVEPTISKARRKEVKKKCADGGLTIWGVGSACEFHSTDRAVVTRNVELAKRFAQLCHDIGGMGVKVRPNGFPNGVSQDKTIEQIGKALRACGQAAADLGVEICCECHGGATSHPLNMHKMIQIADHAAVGVTWNSNRGVDDKEGIDKFREYFKLLRPKIYNTHITELVNGYPYREMFAMFNDTGYDRYTMIEIGGLEKGSEKDTIRFLQFYRGLWEELTRPT